MRARIVRAAARPTNKAPAANFTGFVLDEQAFAPEAPSRLTISLYYRRVTWADMHCQRPSRRCQSSV
jgi:hypothetical protein